VSLLAALDLLLRAVPRGRYRCAQAGPSPLVAAYRRAARMRAPVIVSSIATGAPRRARQPAARTQSFVGLAPGIVSRAKRTTFALSESFRFFSTRTSSRGGPPIPQARGLQAAPPCAVVCAPEWTP